MTIGIGDTAGLKEVPDACMVASPPDMFIFVVSILLMSIWDWDMSPCDMWLISCWAYAPQQAVKSSGRILITKSPQRADAESQRPEITRVEERSDTTDEGRLWRLRRQRARR